MARIRLCNSSAVRVHDSQAHRKMERISRILELREMLLSFQTGFNLVIAAVVCAILGSILESVSVLEHCATWAQIQLSPGFCSL